MPHILDAVIFLNKIIFNIFLILNQKITNIVTKQLEEIL